MLPTCVLINLLDGARHGLTTNSSVAMNERLFNAVTPTIPFDADAVRITTLFLRDNAMSAIGVRLARGDSISYALVVGRTVEDVHTFITRMSADPDVELKIIT